MRSENSPRNTGVLPSLGNAVSERGPKRPQVPLNRIDPIGGLLPISDTRFDSGAAGVDLIKIRCAQSEDIEFAD